MTAIATILAAVMLFMAINFIALRGGETSYALTVISRAIFTLVAVGLIVYAS